MYINTTIRCDDIELKTIILTHLEKTILHYPIQTDYVQLREMVFKNVLVFGRFLKQKQTAVAETSGYLHRVFGSPVIIVSTLRMRSKTC